MPSIRQQINDACGTTIEPDAFREIVVSALVEATGRPFDDAELTSSPAETGLDSFALMSILSDIEERLGVEIPDAVLDRFTEFQDLETMGDLLDLLAA